MKKISIASQRAVEICPGAIGIDPFLNSACDDYDHYNQKELGSCILSPKSNVYYFHDSYRKNPYPNRDCFRSNSKFLIHGEKP